MGTYTAFSDLGAGLGSVIMGILLEVSSYRTMFLSLALAGVINFFYFYFSIFKKERKQKAHLEH